MNETTFGAYVIGNSEPWTPRCVIMGYMEDAATLARQLSGTYVGPLPFEAPRFEPGSSEPSP